MKPEYQKGHKAIAKAPAAKQDHQVNRALFSLPSSTWAMVDIQRKKVGLTASDYIASLVLKAVK